MPFDYEIEQEKKAQELKDNYRLCFQSYPKVLKDIMRDLGMNMDIDPQNVAANALRNFGFHLLAKAGMEMKPEITTEGESL